jgi:hypothetical protein
MSDSYEEQIRTLIAQAQGQLSAVGQLSLLEEAVRLADLHQRFDLGFRLRRRLIEASFFSGHPDRAVVAFTWRLAQCDREPARFRENDLLWEYKWILVSCASFPQVPRAQIEEMLADMTQRYQRGGCSLRAVHRAACYVGMYLGDPEMATERFTLWQQAPRDTMAEDKSDEQSFQVQYHAYLGHHEQTLELAGPILAGTLRDPGGTGSIVLSRVLLPLWRLGRRDEAWAAHRRGYRLIGDNPYYLEEVSDHLRFLVLADSRERALPLVEKHLGWALQAANLREKLYFLRMARFLFERLEATGPRTLPLRLPDGFPVYQDSGHYETAALQQWLDSACRDLAERFDRRNRSHWYSQQLEEASGWHAWIVSGPGEEQT